MSWHCSRALVVEFWAGHYLDGDVSAQLNTTPMPVAYYWPDKTTEHSRLSRFGMTSEPLMEDLGEELLMWFREVFLAKTSALPAKVTDSTANAVDSGRKWQGWFAKYDRDSSSWRTPQHSLLGGLDEFLETWPRWGSMRNGVSYLRQTAALPTCESASGFWQTPVADDAVERKAGKWNSRGEPKLSAQVILWPTPTVCGNYNRKGASKTSGDGLATAVRMWRTPNASDASKWSKQTLEERLEKGQQIRLNTQVSPDGSQAGLLNPNWVEWLMAWPIGWTDLNPLGTDRLVEWQQQHSLSLPADLSESA